MKVLEKQGVVASSLSSTEGEKVQAQKVESEGRRSHQNVAISCASTIEQVQWG